MKIFIRFDKLENYSCDGTAFVSFVLRLRLPSSSFRASTKVEKSFFLPFAFFYYLQPLPVFPFVIVQTEKEKSWRVKKEEK